MCDSCLASFVDASKRFVVLFAVSAFAPALFGTAGCNAESQTRSDARQRDQQQVLKQPVVQQPVPSASFDRSAADSSARDASFSEDSQRKEPDHSDAGCAETWTADAAIHLPDANPSYVGATWASCADGFRPSDQPQRDITRLSFLCGPYHGMHRDGKTWLGHVGAGSPMEVEASLSATQCARVFATAAQVQSLRVSVMDEGGVLIGFAQSAEPFVMANPDGAMCVSQTGKIRIRLEAAKGAGSAAVELWVLPPG